MARFVRSIGWAGAVYVLLGVACWPVPLLGLLHVESAALVAFVAFFVAGVSALGAFRSAAAFGRVLGRHEALLLIPWALLTLSLLWRPNCGYGQGLLFYALFPPISVGLAVALAYVLSATRLRRPRLVLVLIGLAVTLAGPLYDLGLHPQFYTYNHVFGGVLGPIYDEELAVRPGLFAFRALTLLWALGLYIVGRRLRQPEAAWRWTAGLVGVALVLGLGYACSGALGFNTPAWAIRDALGGHVRTAHFDIYYDPASITEERLRRLAEDHEYRYATLADRLGVDVPERIQSYLYPDPATKAALTGARETNVAPVWLRTPQSHVLLDRYSRVFTHELAHVFSREFGLPVIRASLSVGMVEGFAEALEPPSGLPSLDEQVLVATTLRVGVGEGSLADDLAARLSASGFWTGRGAVSYTVMGSFVRFLLERYGAAKLRQVYARGNFAEVYGMPVVDLAAAWEASLYDQPYVARSAGALTERRFSAPSLFEVPCPHHVPRYRRQYRAALDALAEADTARALPLIDASLDRQPNYAAALHTWAEVRLARHQAEAVVQRLDTAAATAYSPALLMALGDARVRLGEAARADAAYTQALDRLPLYAHEAHSLLVLRKSLADQSAIVEILTSGGPAAAQAERLAAFGDVPAARVLQALYLAASDPPRYDDALALLRDPVRLPGVSAYAQGALDRQQLVWQARTARQAGRLAEAEALHRDAAAAYRTLGDLNAAAALDDLADKMAWLQAHPLDTGWDPDPPPHVSEAPTASPRPFF